MSVKVNNGARFEHEHATNVAPNKTKRNTPVVKIKNVSNFLPKKLYKIGLKCHDQPVFLAIQYLLCSKTPFLLHFDEKKPHPFSCVFGEKRTLDVGTPVEPYI